MTQPNESEWETIECLMAELVEGQKAKLLKCGRAFVPTLTPEDMLQPVDYPELESNPHFRYEEGILDGVQTAQMAISALRRDLELGVNL